MKQMAKLLHGALAVRTATRLKRGSRRALVQQFYPTIVLTLHQLSEKLRNGLQISYTASAAKYFVKFEKEKTGRQKI